MNATAPDKSEYPEYYDSYIKKVSHTTLEEALSNSGKDLLSFMQNIPQEKLGHRYAEGKWSVKEVLLHIIDAERIFAYRALRFARNDKSDLPGFDENKYVPESGADNRSIDSLIEEYTAVHKASTTLFNSFTNEMIGRSGTANGKQITVRAIGFVIAGHSVHHLQVLKERYLG